MIALRKEVDVPVVLTQSGLLDTRSRVIVDQRNSATAQQRQGSSAEPDERRAKIRYGIELDVRFSLTALRPRVLNVGKTINMSSSGLLVSSASCVNVGAELQLMIEWPWTLDGKVPLQLVAAGVVVRSTATAFAVALRSYQFRTMKPKAVRQALA